MKQFAPIFITILFFILIGGGSKGQVVSVTNPGNATPALAATYGSLQAAVTALDLMTSISGPVIITLNAGNNQTAPAGGYTINFTAATTATNNVIIKGSNNTITASNALTAGSLTDAIFKIIGSDYVTIQDFTMQENAANTITAQATNNMTEWGVALLYRNTTDGSQNNTILNNTISLNRTYQNSFGIYSNTRHSSTNVGVTADITNNTTAPNSNNKVYGNNISNVNMGISFIGAANVAANMDTGNDIGGNSAATGNTITNWGGATTTITTFISNSGTYHGIFTNHEIGVNISYNTVTSAAISGTTINARGIHVRYNTLAPVGAFTNTISNNTVTLNYSSTGAFDGILSEQISNLSTATVNITNNKILNSFSNSVQFNGITNTSSCGVLNISNNIFRGNTSAATANGFTAISNSGAVISTININNNSIGDVSGDAITFSAATTGSLIGVSCSSAATTANVSISNNNFKGFVQSVAGSGSHTYITLTHAPSSATTDNINSNTFTNITANTSGSVTFINRAGAMASNAGATENCNNNSIITAFSKIIAGNTVMLYNTAATCLSGNTMIETGNDFSNITLTGATAMNGWNNIEGGASGPTKTINNNIFKNWTCGSGSVIVIQADNGGDNSTISGNDIENISGSSFISCIYLATGNKLKHTISNNIIASITAGNTLQGIVGGSNVSTLVTISGNDIHSLSSTGTNQSEAIKITGGTTVGISKNKIYSIGSQNAAGITYGIDIATVTANATYNIVNNIIGDLRADITNNGLAIRGINVGTPLASNSSFNIYYNTVYLNATSTGTDFGTAALYLTTSAGATTGAATLRNNIFVNTSTARGAGVTAVYRRSANQLTNYAAASNNNIFYAGTPSLTNLIFYDGTNSDQTLAAFKTRVSTRETASFTEMPPFLSTSGASASFLRLDPAVPTQAESGAVNISGYTDDYDADIRQGNAGYTGTSTTGPDIGADETDAIYSELNPPVITYSAIISPTCTFTGMTITGVNITDATGVPLSGSNRPRIYYRKNAGSWFSQPGTNTGGTATNSTWSFTIVETDMGSVTGGDVVSYYIIAQDLNPVVNVGSNPSAGLVATSVNNVTTPPSTPNSYTLLYNLSGTYTVGSGGNFTTLTAAVAAYNNACSLGGAIVFELKDNTYGSETFPITINNRVDASSTNTLTIRPSATATPLITSASGTQIFNLNGARYITIDGRQGGTGTSKSLTISNTNVASATIQFINDAQNDLIKYCIIQGMRNSAFSGTITFLTASASGTGNDNNTIDNNDITDAAGGQSNNGIYSAGTAGKENDNITISNNNISNYFNAATSSNGIWVAMNSNSWIITGNRLFQTATRVYTATSIHFGIYITPSTGSGFTVSNNVIGFANSSGTGTTNMIGNSVALVGFPASYSGSGTAVSLRYVGIGISQALVGTTSTIDGNTVGGIAMYTSSNASTLSGMFCAIYIESGSVNIGVNAGNTIGSTSGNNSIYVATSGSGGTLIGIRAASIISCAIQNNTIGSITCSGTGTSVSGNFTGINIGGTCNYTISNNSVGNTSADNIRVGYVTASGALSNAGSFTATTAGVTANFKGITSTATGNILAINNNILRGWAMSCGAALNIGIESSGALSGSNASVNVNNNALGTAATNWINSTVDNNAFFYSINVTNTLGTTYNIKNNDIRGTFFGTQTTVGGSFLRLQGASSANAIATISGNTFTNPGFKFSSGGTLYFIFTSYTIHNTGQLIIDNNSIAGTFTATGNATYHMAECLMGGSASSQMNITNNNFSNFSLSTSSTSDIFGIHSSLSGNSCLLNITGNTISNITSGVGSMTSIDIFDMIGTATCSNNTISNIATQGDIGGINLNSGGTSGQFTISNNTISSVVSTGGSGFINGIEMFVPSTTNTTQTTISNNKISGFSSADAIGVIAGIYLYQGHSSSIVNVTANKIYDIVETAIGSHTYGIFNETTLSGNITYTNNYIGDLRAPISNVSDPAVAGMKLYMNSGSAKVYYNTIHLNATGVAGTFSTAAIYADAASDITLRNNIFSNISAHGGTGKTVAYWRGDTNLGTYNAASNNNLFYAGTASSQNLLFYDGTNSDQTLAAYQARVSPRDSLSASAAQNFISTTGSNANFLHIAASGNCSVNARGSNAGILLTTDYDNDARSTSSPFVTDIGADEFSKKNAWTGTNGTNWNDTGNWSEGVVPNVNDDNVTISNIPVNQPVIATGETYQVASVIMGTGASLTNKGTLKIAGGIYADPASINNIQAGIVQGSVEMNGNCSIAQGIAGNVFVSNGVNNFTVSNDVKISATAGEHLNVSGSVSFGLSGKTLTTGDNLTLVSTANATANVADVTGNFITGKATVERFVNTGLVVNGQHLKSWQFLSTPTTGQTIFESWQESGTTPSGYGTIITGTGTGFDISTTAPSMKFYDNSTNNWTGVTNTGNSINDKRGYMIFVRGDRSVTAYNQNATPTNLRTKGTLYQPSAPPPATTVQAGKFESVGNPYASAIDVSYMKNNGLFVNLDNDVVVWDPLLAGTFLYGGYQTLSASNNYEPTAGGTTYYPSGIPAPYIQSGQAFFVHSSGPVGSVTFNEATKANGSRLVNRPPAPVADRKYFRVTLYTNNGIIADGNAVAFDQNFSNGIDRDDAYKIDNNGENFGLSRSGQTLAVEAHAAVCANDTIFYNMWNLKKQAYQLRFAPKNMQSANLKAFLIDRYLHTSTALSLSDSSFINIIINTDSLSYASNRFFVVFRQKTPIHTQPTHDPHLITLSKTISKDVPENKESTVSVYPNPVENKILHLHFVNKPAGSFQLRLINNLGQPVYSNNIELKGSVSDKALTLPNSLSPGTYSINIISSAGERIVMEVFIK